MWKSQEFWSSHCNVRDLKLLTSVKQENNYKKKKKKINLEVYDVRIEKQKNREDENRSRMRP